MLRGCAQDGNDYYFLIYLTCLNYFIIYKDYCKHSFGMYIEIKFHYFNQSLYLCFYCFISITFSYDATMRPQYIGINCVLSTFNIHNVI